MHAYLIISPNLAESEIKVAQLLQQEGLVRRNWELTKIADIRELERFTKLTLNSPTAIVITGFEKASVAAQNAFLKNLEEPQKKLKYIICSTTIGGILPTVHSRCEIIEIKSTKAHSEKFLNLAGEFTDGDYEARYKIFTKITKREEAIEFVEALISVLRANLRTEKKRGELLRKALSTLNALQRNGNVGLQLTNLAI